MQKALKAFETAALEVGWSIEVRQSSETFVRLLVTGDSVLLVDLALDSAPGMAPTMSVLGPTFAPQELAARKLLALFDRAMPRDFVDVYVIPRTQDTSELLSLDAMIDPGLDAAVLASAIRQLERYRDEDLPIKESDISLMRAFFADWATQLR